MFTLYIFLMCLSIPLGQFSSEFTSVPEYPVIGESLILKCRLNAPAGMKFSQTAPKLRTDNMSNSFSFSFDEISVILNDLDYNGRHKADLDQTNLVGDITMLFLKESDLTRTFICTAKLENDTYIELMLSLNSSSNLEQTATSPTVPGSVSNTTIFDNTSAIATSTSPEPQEPIYTAWIVAIVLLSLFCLILLIVFCLILLIVFCLYCICSYVIFYQKEDKIPMVTSKDSSTPKLKKTRDIAVQVETSKLDPPDLYEKEEIV